MVLAALIFWSTQAPGVPFECPEQEALGFSREIGGQWPTGPLNIQQAVDITCLIRIWFRLSKKCFRV
jgi:hypothetical protein